MGEELFGADLDELKHQLKAFQRVDLLAHRLILQFIQSYSRILWDPY